MNWQNNLRYRYHMFGVTEKLILINVLVFVAFILLGLISFLFRLPGSFLHTLNSWLILPSDVHEFIFKPWTIITYAFMHEGFWHILWNMVVLYFAGHIFLQYFSPKRMLNYYFLGAIVGGALFILSYNVFPAFSQGKPPLLGASAAIMAVLIGVATYAPNLKIRLFLLGNIKLWWIAAFFVGQDLIMIPFHNSGGHIAHIGGAALGFIYTRQLSKGTDIGAWFERLMNGVVGLFSSKPENPFKKVYKNKTKPGGKRGAYQTNHRRQESETDKQKKIDAILDKIGKNGYDSLSKEEKEFLFSVGRD